MNWSNNDHNKYHHDTYSSPPISLSLLEDNSKCFLHMSDIKEVLAKILVLLCLYYHTFLLHSEYRVKQPDQIHGNTDTEHPIKTYFIEQNSTHRDSNRNADIKENINSPNPQSPCFHTGHSADIAEDAHKHDEPSSGYSWRNRLEKAVKLDRKLHEEINAYKKTDGGTHIPDNRYHYAGFPSLVAIAPRAKKNKHNRW